MSTKAQIEDKISAIQRYLAILEKFKAYPRVQLESDDMIRGATERYLYLLAQSAIDLAEMLIAYKKYRKPSTLSESFEILHEHAVIDIDLQEKMIKLTGFRNILAHGYTKVDYGIVHSVLHHRLEDVADFIKIADQV